MPTRSLSDAIYKCERLSPAGSLFEEIISALRSSLQICETTSICGVNSTSETSQTCFRCRRRSREKCRRFSDRSLRVKKQIGLQTFTHQTTRPIKITLQDAIISTNETQMDSTKR